MIGLDEKEYRDGIRSLAFLVRRSAESQGEKPSPDGLIRRNVCVKCGYEWEVKVGTPLPKRCPSCMSTLWNEKTLKRHVCRCCGHVWMSRRADPDRCPSCRSRLWAEEPRCFRCTGCGHVQRSRSAVVRCEACGSRSIGEVPRSSMSAVSLIPSLREDISRMSSMSRPEAVGYLMDRGFVLEDAEAVVRCISGDGAVEIASDLDVPVGRVLSIGSCLRRSLWGGSR